MSSLSSHDVALASPQPIYVASSSDEMQSDDQLTGDVVAEHEVLVQRTVRTKIERHHETSIDEGHSRYESGQSAPKLAPSKSGAATKGYTRVIETHTTTKSSHRSKNVESDDEDILRDMQKRRLRDGEDQEFKHKEIVVAELPPHATLGVRDILQKGIDFGFQTEDLRFITVPSPVGHEIGCGCDLFWRPDENRPYGGIEFIVRSKYPPSPIGVDKCVGCGLRPQLRLTASTIEAAPSTKTTGAEAQDTRHGHRVSKTTNAFGSLQGRVGSPYNRGSPSLKQKDSYSPKKQGVNTSIEGGTLVF